VLIRAERSARRAAAEAHAEDPDRVVIENGAVAEALA
jgi:hypothetical protein